MSGTGHGKFTPMSDGSYGVENHGRGLWRAVYRDDSGEWSVTGPPMRTKVEAMVFWSDARVASYFGEVVAS